MAEPAAPVAPAERIEGLDVLRGFALLGILLLNIIGFGLPAPAYFNPSVDGATEGLGFTVYATVDVFFEGVMRALFSMLFGAGVVIFAAGRSAAIYYRRQFLLLGFGVFNALVLLWYGDILVPYALAGMVLYLARDWSVRRLLVATAVVFAWLAILYNGLFAAFSFLPAKAPAIAERVAAGEQVSPEELGLLQAWQELEPFVDAPAEEIARDAAAHTAPYPEAFAANAEGVVALWTGGLPITIFWDALGCMLLGMALYRAGVLQGVRSDRYYIGLATIGLAVGLGVNAFELGMRIATDFGLRWTPSISTPTHDIGRVASALGYLGIVMLICRRGLVATARRWLAAVGRMALTNYLTQSLLCLLIFHELGLGWWNRLDRAQLYLVVLAIWALQVAWSVAWLRRYRYGPLEWLWRGLTYGRMPAQTR